MILLSVNRKGHFYVGSLDTKKGIQCGIVNETHKYEYIVRITASNKNLTKEGFVIDNKEIEAYFYNTYAIKPIFDCISCEEMVERAIEFFEDRCGHNRVDVREIEVKIIPTDFAYIVGTWRKGRKV